MNTQREARRDAREYARAQMYYGEGAGTRRKLITATVDAKAHRDPAYERAFHDELSRQDMAEHASKARRERQRTDAVSSVKQNSKAVISGNYQNMQSGALLVVVVGYFVHQTGVDKLVWEKGKTYYRNFQHKRAIKRVVRDTTPSNY